MQHYAALGRDLTGGFAVNLCPSDKPQVGGPAGRRLGSLRWQHADGACMAVWEPSDPPQQTPAVPALALNLQQDVYTEISSLVKRRVAADAAAGVPEAQAIVKYTQGGWGWLL